MRLTGLESWRSEVLMHGLPWVRQQLLRGVVREKMKTGKWEVPGARRGGGRKAAQIGAVQGRHPGLLHL